MKYYILQKVAKHLSNFKKIKLIKRVQNNTIRIEFDKNKIYYFDLSKGNSLIYKKPHDEISTKDFNAPFDVLLQKTFNNAAIKKVYLYNDDKILNIEVSSSSSYKQQNRILQFEFTGIYTNIIILDEQRVVLEALRHIDEDKSIRVVKVGKHLEEIPKPNFKPQIKEIDDIEQFLLNLYLKKEEQELELLKKQKIATLQKNIKKLKKLIELLGDKKALEEEANDLYEKANLILSNLHQIKPYLKSIELYNFSGDKIRIELDTKFPTPSSYANYLFSKAKRTKQKAANQYKEKINLEEKLLFFNRLINTINSADSIDEVEFYFPKKEKKQIKTKKSQPYQSFFIDGYKIMLGRDERENIYLLKNSRASDFWFHLKDRASSHVIVSNTKKSIPNKIIETAAKICARFSVDFKGDYLVDYTQRRNVNIQSKANVLYNEYKTINVRV